MRFPLQSLRRASPLAVLLAGASALGLGLIGPASASQPGPLLVIDSGPGPGDYAIEGYTAYTGDTGVFGYGALSSITGVTGVEGYVTSGYSTGVVGYSASTGNSAFGVYGYSNSGNGLYGQSNTSAVASIYGLNSVSGGTAIYGYSAGNGVLGTSSATNGVVGTTQTSSTSNHYAGVLGSDNSTAGSHYGVAGASTNNIGVYGTTAFPGNVAGAIAGVRGSDVSNGDAENDGVLGTTTNGGFGVYGSSTDDGVGGVYGSATTGTGVWGSSSGGGGVYGISQNFYGVYGTSTNDSAIHGEESNAYPSVVGANDSSGDGVFGTSSSGYGGVFTTTTGFYALVASGDEGGVYAITPPGGAYYPLVLQDTSSDNLFYVNGSGDVYISGTYNYISAIRGGGVAHTFTARSSAPTIEDSGSGQIVNGTGMVRLDPALVAQMDRTTTYRVFLTPDGDTRGLYVASKTPAGFVVRETQGGHGTLTFDYRILANVDGQANRRMTVSAPGSLPHPPAALHITQGRTASVHHMSAKEAAFQRSIQRSMALQQSASAHAARPATLGPMPKRLAAPVVHKPLH